MSLLTPVNHDLPSAHATIELDAIGLAMLRTLAGGHPAHPSLGGPAGQRALRSLASSGLLTDSKTLSPAANALVAPISEASRTLHVHTVDRCARRRQVWIAGEHATTATPHPDGTLTLRRLPSRLVGADLTTWLGVRPLPEPELRTPASIRPGELSAFAEALGRDDHVEALAIAERPMPVSQRRLLSRVVRRRASAWFIETWPSNEAVRSTRLIAVDQAQDGWWLAEATRETEQQVVELRPVGVAAIYVALSHLG